MKEPRERGYYWVLWEGEWFIADYQGKYEWYLGGHEYPIYEASFDEIDERRVVRDTIRTHPLTPGEAHRLLNEDDDETQAKEEGLYRKLRDRDDKEYYSPVTN